MKAQFFLPSVDGNLAEGKPPINVKFEIPYFTTSGIQVRYLKIIEKSGYQALPWVRYITQNGDYQLRTQWADQSGFRINFKLWPIKLQHFQWQFFSWTVTLSILILVKIISFYVLLSSNKCKYFQRFCRIFTMLKLQIIALEIFFFIFQRINIQMNLCSKMISGDYVLELFNIYWNQM